MRHLKITQAAPTHVTSFAIYTESLPPRMAMGNDSFTRMLCTICFLSTTITCGAC